jgi:hypothetical protein
LLTYMKGNYLQKRDRPNTGYNFIGIAYRMALGLGLHREPPGATIGPEPFSNQRRRVMWWITYCFDSGFSFTTGRPIMVSDSFIETKLPRNVDDSVSLGVCLTVKASLIVLTQSRHARWSRLYQIQLRTLLPTRPSLHRLAWRQSGV